MLGGGLGRRGRPLLRCTAAALSGAVEGGRVTQCCCAREARRSYAVVEAGGTF